VFGARVAADVNAAPASAMRLTNISEAAPAKIVDPSPTLRSLMSNNVGVVRTEKGLSRALGVIAEMDRTAVCPSAKNIAAAALLIAAAAYFRQESRGAHFRQDFPATDPEQARRTMITLTLARQIAAEVTTDWPLAATVH
jgi:L-aspartate oxidase